MKRFEIKHKSTDRVLFSVEAENIKEAVEVAKESGAYLRGAYLRGADLRGAYLGGADLRDADLRGADLRDADLRGADLRGADGINPYLSTPLLMLKDQPGKIRAYKLVNQDDEGHYRGGVKYRIGDIIDIPEADTDPTKQCAAGANIATLDWCMKEWQEGFKIRIVEFEAKDIAVIPTATDGKFRVRHCEVVGEKDLKEIGLIKQAEPAQAVGE